MDERELDQYLAMVDSAEAREIRRRRRNAKRKACSRRSAWRIK